MQEIVREKPFLLESNKTKSVSKSVLLTSSKNVNQFKVLLFR